MGRRGCLLACCWRRTKIARAEARHCIREKGNQQGRSALLVSSNPNTEFAKASRGCRSLSLEDPRKGEKGSLFSRQLSVSGENDPQCCRAHGEPRRAVLACSVRPTCTYRRCHPSKLGCKKAARPSSLSRTGNAPRGQGTGPGVGLLTYPRRRRAAPQQPLCDVSDRCGSSVGSVICGVATAPHSLSLHLGSAQHLPRAHGRHILVRHEPSSTGRSAATLVLFLLLRLDGRALRRRCRIRI